MASAVVRAPRHLSFGPHGTVPADAAAGRVSAELVAPYPPGVPVLAPGELVTAEIVAALRAVLADGGRVAYAADPTLATVQVVAGALTPGRVSRVTVKGWRRSSPRPSARHSGGGTSAGPGR